jgi:hypothetical protein
MNTMLENFVREISGKEPGKNWALCWKKAYLDKVISIYSSGLDWDRKKVDLVYKYTLYFALISYKIKQYNLSLEQIYNIDKKGFILRITIKK